MALFKIPNRGGKEADSKAIGKRNNRQKVAAPITTSGSSSIQSRIAVCEQLAKKYYGSKMDSLQCVTDYEEFVQYIDDIIDYGYCSLDTETDGLDTVDGNAAGVCLYVPGRKKIYVPTGHISHMTHMLIKGQITVQQMHEQLQRLADSNIKIVYHNAKFDMKVVYFQYNVMLPDPYWDTQIGANLLNEMEPHGLKYLYDKYVSNEDEQKSAKFEELFKGIPFPMIPINIAYLYAANDPGITWDVYLFQKEYLNKDGKYCKQKGLERVSEVFHEIEMPLIKVITKMEIRGIRIDVGYAKELSLKYNEKLEKCKRICNDNVAMYNDLIQEFKRKKPELGRKLDNPILLSSPTQLSILLYDILKLKSPDGSRGTGEDILKSLKHPICDAILELRGLEKLVGTYIDKIPNLCAKRDSRLHANFNQYGARTGRFSSSDPNLQNIPSHNTDIRKMFAATEGYVLVGSDYSQQEPRCLAYMSGDENMRNAYLEGKDLYGIIASKLYKMPYEDCLEFRPDGTTNKDGKKRRSSVKPILLGIMYGRGSESIAQQMGITKKEAEQTIKDFFVEFPAVADFVDSAQNFAREHGFVETAKGRKRRIPDMVLDEYEFHVSQSDCSSNFDPLDFDEDDEMEDYVPEHIISKYCAKLNRCWGWKKKQEIIQQAKEEGYEIIDNTAKISAGSRQCVNSIIQGSSADITKTAMIAIDKDPILNSLDFHLLITVHDEVIGECPYENREKAAARLTEVMIDSAKSIIDIPMKCDAEITYVWYGESVK